MIRPICPFCKKELEVEKVDSGYVVFHNSELFDDGEKVLCCPIATPPVFGGARIGKDGYAYDTLGYVVYDNLNELMKTWQDMRCVEIVGEEAEEYWKGKEPVH